VGSTAFANVKADELKRHVLHILPLFEGWCSKEKAEGFVDLVLETRPDVCVEIGAFGGASVFPAASALKMLDHGMLYAIDPWDKIESIKYFDPVEDAAHLKWWGNLDINYIYHNFISMLTTHVIQDYVTPIRATSEMAASMIDSIDILHIDGNHSESVSIFDVQTYLPKVKDGGYIWYNDALWRDRQEALDLLLEACDIVKVIDDGNCILFQKR